jgi:hypothetical protein
MYKSDHVKYHSLRIKSLSSLYIRCEYCIASLSKGAFWRYRNFFYCSFSDYFVVTDSNK